MKIIEAWKVRQFERTHNPYISFVPLIYLEDYDEQFVSHNKLPVFDDKAFFDFFFSITLQQYQSFQFLNHLNFAQKRKNPFSQSMCMRQCLYTNQCNMWIVITNF